MREGSTEHSQLEDSGGTSLDRTVARSLAIVFAGMACLAPIEIAAQQKPFEDVARRSLAGVPAVTTMIQSQLETRGSSGFAERLTRADVDLADHAKLFFPTELETELEAHLTKHLERHKVPVESGLDSKARSASLHLVVSLYRVTEEAAAFSVDLELWQPVELLENRGRSGGATWQAAAIGYGGVNEVKRSIERLAERFAIAWVTTHSPAQ
jgi:fructose-specific phosphotransferase system component IIB